MEALEITSTHVYEYTYLAKVSVIKQFSEGYVSHI